jgi:hypothetical protein
VKAGAGRRPRLGVKACALVVGLSSWCPVAACAAETPGIMTNDICVVPFSHLDLMWAGTPEECLSRGGQIITKAVQIAERHPEFRCLLEDEDFVANYVWAHHGVPELEAFKRLVR